MQPVPNDLMSAPFHQEGTSRWRDSLGIRRCMCAVFVLMLCVVLSAPSWAASSLASLASGSGNSVEKLVQFEHGVIERLAALGPRVTGTPGCEKTADIISEFFQELDMGDVGRQLYRVPVTSHASATISVNGGPALPIAPTNLNAVTPNATDASGIRGHVIYAGSGAYAEFNGKAVKDAIVLLDIDSGKNWINAAQLGALAVVYVDAGVDGKPTSKGYFDDKFELTPIRFPRFWMTQERARELFGDYHQLADTVDATLTAAANWRDVAAENVFLFIEGTDKTLGEQAVIVDAFYDTSAYVPGQAPGADQSASLTALLDLAVQLKVSPPKRSVLLVAASGQWQSMAGLREFISAIRIKGKELREEERSLRRTVNQYKATLEALEALSKSDNPASLLGDPAIKDAFDVSIKDQVDSITSELMRLRLVQHETHAEQIEALGLKRRLLRSLSWSEDLSRVDAKGLAVLKALLPETRLRYKQALKDAKVQLKCVRSAKGIRRGIALKDIVASTSLYLSSHGNGVGAFNDGWAFDLLPRASRPQIYGGMSRHLNMVVNAMHDQGGKQAELAGLYRDGLRQSRIRPWQTYFVDNPMMGGEISALSGIMGFTLATVNDARPLWGTPSDTPDRVNYAVLANQILLVRQLVSSLANDPLDLGDRRPRNVYSTLTGRAMFIRQGELFPDKPAPGTLLLIFQDKTRFYTMVESDGTFRLTGVSSKKLTVHKLIIEGYRFSDDTGKTIWAIDKKQTGKANYRIKMSRTNMETDLIMFGCRQSTLFSTFDPRTFRYFTKINLLDARREAPPLRSWFSRLDTRDSTILSVFLEPSTAYKLILSDTVLTKKMLLLGTTPQNPQGRGYNVDDWPILTKTEYMAAKDMWNLLAPRIKNLEDKGIFNQRVSDMKAEGERLLSLAHDAWMAKRYDDFVASARQAWAVGTRVYTDVEKTQHDVLMGVLFYIALFVPFAYCLERVLFSYADIHKRILAFSGILAAVIAVIYQVHPAFELTYSPLVVILAFFIIGLSVMVSLIIFMRFEQEMINLQNRAKHVTTSEISKLKAFMAAFAIGVSNLRRRKVRTALTCTTLVILTFTIMSFTAVKSVREEGAVQFKSEAPYRGILIKDVSWKTLPPEAKSAVFDMFSDNSRVSPRGWMELKSRTDPALVRVLGHTGDETAQSVIGLGAAEPNVSGIGKALTAGRWFTEAERNVALLPDTMAERLGIRPGVPGADTISLWGMSFQVVGTFSGTQFNDLLDLDGEPLTSVVFPSESALEVTEVEQDAIESGEDVRSFQSRYQHLDAAQTVVIPFETLSTLGGQLKSIAISSHGLNRAEETALATRLADRFGLTVFSGESDGAYVYYTADALNYSGVPNIIIPLIISMLIVLNTMIGSVYERKREIGVYTAVGLAPSHVAFLFIAESLAFAVMSVVLGYLIAQISAGLLAGTSMWSGMTANYSSLAGVAAMVLVILVVLVSVIYPSKVAADIAIPDVNRSWTLPEPVNDTIQTKLPFLMRIREQACAAGFLYEYYKAHHDISHGLFSTDNIAYDMVCPWEGAGAEAHPKERHSEFQELEHCLRVTGTVWLAPFDFGIKHQVTIIFTPAEWNPGFMEIDVELTRLAGESTMWLRLSKGFLHNLRKQLLVWRSITEEAREHYEQILEKNPPVRSST
ncbi:FtsX-like permease family protein [Desulfovibrio inopinatus]|uniref:FtsX-like permease family protein n=1 Tax=Desulfovibrio inopinatus TaxID=102109 RepID=UPI000687AA75|nr:FtsX-like permease family protein [Desulfovibrio inopinatus]